MKKPSEIYSLTISSYVNKHVVDWENKLPLADLPNIEYDKEEKRTLFGLLLSKPSNTRLSFCDSLYALFSFVGKERRIQLLQWMIETYDEKYDVDVTEYRADESAKWKNTKMTISRLPNYMHCHITKRSWSNTLVIFPKSSIRNTFLLVQYLSKMHVIYFR